MIIFVHVTPSARLDKRVDFKRSRHPSCRTVDALLAWECDSRACCNKRVVKEYDTLSLLASVIGYQRNLFPKYACFLCFFIRRNTRAGFRSRVQYSSVPHFKVKIRSGRLSVFLKFFLCRISVNEVRISHSSRNFDVGSDRRIMYIDRSAEERSDVCRICLCIFVICCRTLVDFHRIEYDRHTVDVLSRPDVVGFFVVKRLTDMHQNSAGSVHILFAHLYLDDLACRSKHTCQTIRIRMSRSDIYIL